MDREKVVKRLEGISDYFFSVYLHSKERKEINKAKDMGDAVEDAIALLKGLEPVAPKIYPETRYCGPTIACGACRHEFAAEQPRFCPYCGTPVKREE